MTTKTPDRRRAKTDFANLEVKLRSQVLARKCKIVLSRDLKTAPRIDILKMRNFAILKQNPFLKHAYVKSPDPGFARI